MTAILHAGALVTAREQRRFQFAPVVWLVFAVLASFALSWAHLAEVWQTGTFFDTDDAMRMVQVRDWLAGQGWYDVTAHRLSPPQGLAMHWSRLVDVPVGALVRLFGFVAPPPLAERLARIAFPLGCQVLLILAFVRAARTLCGPESLGPALLVISLDGFQFGQFVAGRVDHHAPQIVLLIVLAGAVAAGLCGRERRAALAAALATALSLGISLENLPFIAVAVAAVGLAWVGRGPSMARFAGTFGWALAGFVPLVFAATVPPARYTAVTNDALSAPHVLLATLGGAGLALLTRSSTLQNTWARRGGGLLLLAIAIACAILRLCPGFPASPYAAVDPVVREHWLRHVTEALPLFVSVGLHPAAGALIVIPFVAGLLACVWAAAEARGRDRDAWLFVVALTVTGLLGACWEVRVSSSAMPLAALGAVWAVSRAARISAMGLLRSPALRVGLALCPFSPVVCALLPTPDDSPAVAAAAAAAQNCRNAAALAPLADLAPGLVFAPIDVGAHLLAYSGVSVMAAPYHRNNAGNRAVIQGFMAVPAAAEAQVKATGASYLLVCRGESQLAEMAKAAPDSLAAHLLASDAPVWLQRLDLAGTPYQVYWIL